jgi:hypothetical protein
VLITIILAAREPLHRFVGQIVTANEVADVLLISGATLIILPMLPDRPMGPFRALNPHAIWLVVIMILGINAVGQLATRLWARDWACRCWGWCRALSPVRRRLARWGLGARQSCLAFGRCRGGGAFNGGQLCADGRRHRSH